MPLSLAPRRRLMATASYLLKLFRANTFLSSKLFYRLCKNTVAANSQLIRHFNFLEDANFLGCICQNISTEACFNYSSVDKDENASSTFEVETTLACSEIVDSDNNSVVKDVVMVQDIFKSLDNSHDLESAINKCKLEVTEDLVVQILQRHQSDWKFALFFFKWASKQPGYLYGSKSFNLILDILGRMKQLELMQQVFDEVPKERISMVINERTFAILMNRYAAAHKVKSSIEVFYKRKDYGFECHMLSFQTLLMSLCRYKHVDEAEALFLKKRNEFRPVIKSQNIILNGWCVLGKSHETKRFWNDIISSKCKPDMFTYGIFINSLTKSGKIGSAMKLFAAMRKKGYKPDVPIWNCIIDALCFKKRIPEALAIFSEMNEPGFLPNAATYNSLIKHLCKITRMEKVYELLDEMEKKGLFSNTRTYSYLLKATKKPEEVTKLLHKMERTGCKINSDIYNLVLSLYVQWSDKKSIEYVWTELEKSGLGPDQRSYTIMVHGLYKKGNFAEALEYFHKMSSKGMSVEPRTRLLIEAIHLKKEESSAKLDTSPESFFSEE